MGMAMMMLLVLMMILVMVMVMVMVLVLVLVMVMLMMILFSKVARSCQRPPDGEVHVLAQSCCRSCVPCRIAPEQAKGIHAVQSLHAGWPDPFAEVNPMDDVAPRLRRL